MVSSDWEEEGIAGTIFSDEKILEMGSHDYRTL
jgi:hypothetical protein